MEESMRVASRKGTDKELVNRLLAGDSDAFGEFFDTYFPRLYRFALVRLHQDADAAEEVVQAALSRVVQKLATYRGEAALFTWLCTFCRNEISAFYRKRTRQPQRVDLVEEAPEVRAALESLLTSSSGDPQEALQRQELARLVQVTLDHLPPKYGDALEWKYIHGLSVKEIAVRLEVGPKAAESLLGRARKAFRDGFSSMTDALMPGASWS
jgi:RNA polymerase sigma-70 factor (ECF subfamily)